MSAKQAVNDILQGSVATYWRFGGVVNQIKTPRFIDDVELARSALITAAAAT